MFVESIYWVSVTYGVLDLELLASTDVARLGDGGLEAGESLVVQSLCHFPISIPVPVHFKPSITKIPIPEH